MTLIIRMKIYVATSDAGPQTAPGCLVGRTQTLLEGGVEEICYSLQQEMDQIIAQKRLLMKRQISKCTIQQLRENVNKCLKKLHTMT